MSRIAFARGLAQHDPRLRLYAILDRQTCDRRGMDVIAVARSWREAGVGLVQYRDKIGMPAQVVTTASRIREVLPDAVLILNDYAALVEAAGFDGVHLGQNDLSVEDAREFLSEDHIVGVSTHSADQALAANGTDVDYIAIGPVFSTRTKTDAEPVVGVCGVQAARAVTTKPLIAIGGITAERSREVLQAGVDSIAVISALLSSGDPANLTRTARDFLASLQ